MIVTATSSATHAPRIHYRAPGLALWTAPGLVATSVWGPHGLADVQAFFDFMEEVLRDFEHPFDFMTDNVRMRVGDHDWRAFGAIMRWAYRNNQRFAGILRRWVTISASHVVGMAIAGSNRLLGAPFPSSVAPSVDAALDLLGHPDRAALVPWVAALPEHVREATTDIARLRGHLARRPSASLAEAAAALGLGQRTLQRALAAHGTSYRAEQHRAACAPRLDP
ncbi:MAG: hypothetical protein U1F43_16685 [Myxococcota bacterium]